MDPHGLTVHDDPAFHPGMYERGFGPCATDFQKGTSAFLCMCVFCFALSKIIILCNIET
jgi:hypothetical protein